MGLYLGGPTENAVVSSNSAHTSSCWDFLTHVVSAPLGQEEHYQHTVLSVLLLRVWLLNLLQCSPIAADGRFAEAQLPVAPSPRCWSSQGTARSKRSSHLLFVSKGWVLPPPNPSSAHTNHAQRSPSRERRGRKGHCLFLLHLHPALEILNWFI